MNKILFVHSSAELYGSDKSLLYLTESLIGHYKVSVLLPTEGPLVEMLESQGVEVIIKDIPVLRRKYLSVGKIIPFVLGFLRGTQNLKKFFKKEKFDLIYINTSVLISVGLAAKHAKITCIWHVREIISSNFENKVISRIINRCAKFIIANSKATLERINVGDKGIVIHNGIPSLKTNGDVKESMNDAVVIGMAGRINRWKGQELFIDAAALVLETFPNTLFSIAGAVYPGDEIILETLIEKVDALNLKGKIQFLGQVNEIGNFYSGIDIFVLPSTQPEPFGLVVLEAMQYGKPVIATNHGGPTEIITDRKNGYLVDWTNPSEMATTICTLLRDKDLITKIGNEGKKLQESSFSVSVTTQKIKEIIDETISK